MYRKSAKGWLKHSDFILLDLLCLQLGFLIAFWIRHGFNNPYLQPLYRNEAIALVLIQLSVTFLGESFKNVLKRGYYNEFTAAFKQAVMVTLLSTFYLFLVKDGGSYSRLTLLLTGVIYLLLTYPTRIFWKKKLLSGAVGRISPRSMLIVTTRERAEEAVQNITTFNYTGYRVMGLAIMDQSMIGDIIQGISVVADRESIVEYACREWVDEVLVDLPSGDVLSEQIVRAFSTMGITVHQCLFGLQEIENKQQYMERIGKFTVLTTSVNMVSAKQLFYKRCLDIAGGIVGCFLTCILFLFVAPAILIKSPGPIFFAQIRVGRNGKKFKMYKFRSMYVDAEERKKELMEQNRIQDGLMFKMEDDPRIIKGIGHFIRKTSIDEFPQFFNVLKGDMSLVGTRPPTLDEWEKYSLHHRMRLAIKPGITGMWQVSGRSKITDFEEVVKLDADYIEKWSIGLDIKILLKTVGIVVGSTGAM